MALVFVPRHVILDRGTPQLEHRQVAAGDFSCMRHISRSGSMGRPVRARVRRPAGGRVGSVGRSLHEQETCGEGRRCCSQLSFFDEIGRGNMAVLA